MSTFTLKMIALVLMVIDHIGHYFEGAPIVFRILGRACYPLFLFCMVWGYHYTKNRKRFLLRLYLGSVFMTLFGLAVNRFFPTDGYGYGYHNIFLSMFVVGVVISAIELIQRDRKQGMVLIGVIFAVQVLYYTAPLLFPMVRQYPGDVFSGIVPNLVLNEYGFDFVVLGVLMYFLKERRDLFAAMYLLFCIAQFSMEMLELGMAAQWLMVLALPLMLRYNNERGPGMKYFFYVFYPAHSFLLFYLANFVFGK